jgi:hypothetical protein
MSAAARAGGLAFGAKTLGEGSRERYERLMFMRTSW